jgi:N-hydroxyarylamine O-acetyltransferase
MPIDLDAYFRRIEYSGDRRATERTLMDVHLAHATHIPFENLDVMLKRPILIDLESIQAKLVHGRRGGYCFEQNVLLAAVLEQLGFSVTFLAARVRLGAHRILPRTHIILAVDAAGDRWLTDVGFGSFGLLVPVPLITAEYQQFGWRYRVARDGELWVLQGLIDGAWQDIYVFTLETQIAVDFIPTNYYVSTHPDSRFVQTLTVQRVAPEVRRLLKNRDFVTTTHSGETRRTIQSAAELLGVLAEEFQLEFPAGTEFLPAELFTSPGKTGCQATGAPDGAFPGQ